MGELARRLDARDLWISRGHLWAAGIGASLLAVIAFSLGVLVGGSEPAQASGVDPLGLATAPDDRLVDLLARVEATADPSGGVSALTFPEVLEGAAETRVPEPPRGFSGAAVVETGVVAPPLHDVRPEGEWTIVVTRTADEGRARALRDQLAARDLPVWVAAERDAGTPSWTVSLGGFPTEAAATTAAQGLAESSSDLPVLGGVQVIRVGSEVSGG